MYQEHLGPRYITRRRTASSEVKPERSTQEMLDK